MKFDVFSGFPGGPHEPRRYQIPEKRSFTYLTAG